MSTIVELMVHMDCPGCENKIKKVLERLEEGDRLTVIGCAGHVKILRTARKNGRQAELWPFPDTQEEFDHYDNYDQYENHNNLTTHYLSFHNIEYTSAYDYTDSTHYGHEYEHGYYHQPAQSKMLDREASAYFSDENTNACSVL